VSALSDLNGALVYVMGPSGAGKDSVLNRARTLLPDNVPVVFAHRYITRSAEAGGENHIELSPAEFGLRRTHGLFAFHWRAHGNEYGIGREIYSWRRAGLTVVVSGSREHFQQIAGIDDNTHPVLITAPAERLAQRLTSRAREDAEAAAERLQRSEAYDVTDRRLVTIVNDGPLDAAATRFVSLLATLQCSPDVRRRA
jgi:ribose 1,5-bisphosphokinase